MPVGGLPFLHSAMLHPFCPWLTSSWYNHYILKDCNEPADWHHARNIYVAEMREFPDSSILQTLATASNPINRMSIMLGYLKGKGK